MTRQDNQIQVFRLRGGRLTTVNNMLAIFYSNPSQLLGKQRSKRTAGKNNIMHIAIRDWKFLAMQGFNFDKI